MALNKLSSRKVATAAKGTYQDDGGLRLVVLRTGLKKWVFRYMIRLRRRDIGLGSFPTVSLVEAREKAVSARRQLALGLDPIQERADVVQIPSFTTCADHYIDSM